MRGSRLRRKSIYIPIWLDLLYNKPLKSFPSPQNLHSNMVRFIIDTPASILFDRRYLHSNMVRFIINIDYLISKPARSFTFQYG